MTDANRPGESIRELIERMGAIGQRFDPSDARRFFHDTYTRTTKAVAHELSTGALGGFLDHKWVEEWDIVFADLYLAAVKAWDLGEAPGPWKVAFATARDRPSLPPLRHVLFGINAHVNYDLPQALLGVITDREFDDPSLVARRARDHEHIDVVLASRVTAEDRSLEGARTLVDRLLTPLNRAGTKRFLKEAREKVWRNAFALSRARREGDETYRRRLKELEGLCAARVTDLVAPGQVILKLARKGFGVVLSGA